MAEKLSVQGRRRNLACNLLGVDVQQRLLLQREIVLDAKRVPHALRNLLVVRIG